jgi:Flp pilus assembly protein protease CpaA
MAETLLTVFVVAAAIILPTLLMALLAGRLGGVDRPWLAVIACGLVVPGAMLLYVFSQMHREGGVGYGDAMGLGVIMLFAAMVTVTLLTSFLTIRRMRRRKAPDQ